MSNEEVPLSPQDDLLKRELDRVHLILSDPHSIESLTLLLKDNISGRVKLSAATKKKIEYLLERKMSTKLRENNGGRRRKRGRPKKRIRTKRTKSE